MNKVCVIMAVYLGDSLDDLSESLFSLYRQTYKDFDIFIQCDGLIKPDVEGFLFTERSNNKIHFLQKRAINKGLAYSLNELLGIVLDGDYDYIARMDADDICSPDRILHQLTFMESHKECDVVGSNIVEFYEDGSERSVLYHTSHEKIKSGFSKKTAIPHVSAFFRKSFFQKSGLYNINSNRNEDQWLWLNGFLSGCAFASIPEELVRVRMSTDLLKRRADFRHNLATFHLRNRIVSLLKFNKFHYLYNILVFVVKMQPAWILKIIYKLR